MWVQFSAHPNAGSLCTFQAGTARGIGRKQLLKLLVEDFRDQRANEILDPIPTLATVDDLINIYELDPAMKKQGQQITHEYY